MSSLHIEKASSFRELDRKDVVRVGGVVSSAEKPSDALICVTEKKRELMVWTLLKGCKSVQKCGKNQSKNVLWTGTEELATGVFYLYNSGSSLGFALLMHSADNPYILQGKPHDFSENVAALFVSDQKEKKKKKEFMEPYSIRRAQLQQTTKGLVVAAVVALLTGELFLIVGFLQQDEWRKWLLEPFWSSQPCIYISVDGKEVRLVRCDISTPLDPYAAVMSPTIPLALSTFDRVFGAGSEDAAATSSQHGGANCLIFKDKVFPIEGGTAVQDRFYQSQCFTLAPGAYSLPYQCLVDVQKKKPLFSIVVPCQSFSSLVHLRSSGNGAEIVASCSIFESLRLPVALCNIAVECASRAEGTLVTLVLSQEWNLFACEVLGSPLDVSVNNEGASLALCGDASQRQSGSHIKMLDLGKGRFVCSTGSACVVYNVAAATFTEALPERVSIHSAEPPSAEEDANEEQRTHLLEKCLNQLEQLKQTCSADKLAEVAFRQVIPTLRYVGSTQSEVFLIERVFKRILECSQAKSEEDWSVLWALTGIVQRILSKRSRDNSVLYTDQFFLSLVDKYKKGAFKTPEGTSTLKEAAGHTLSAELGSVAHTALTATKLPAEARFVMEGLGGGEPFLPFAEEVIRRMVTSSTLSNGASLVRAKQGMGSCLHVVGVALLASCLDISVYIYAAEPGCLLWSLDPVEASTTFVPVREFASQEEFEKALALAADLLCITSEDASYRPEVAFYALALGQRTHCLQAFLVLFSTLVRSALSRQEPFSENTKFLERVSKSLGCPFDMQIAASLHSPKCDLITALSYVACSGGAKLLTPLFRSYVSLFPESFCTSLLVGFLFYSTDRLISAQNNYGAAAVKALIAKDEAERSNAMETLHVCKDRLRTVRADLLRLWSETHVLSPYKVEDIASSYLSSVRISAEGSNYRGRSSGTVVSRTVVLCYRIFALIDLAHSWESQTMGVGASVVQLNTEDLSESHSLISGALRSFQALFMAKGSPLPVEWLQSLFLRMVQRALNLVRSSPEWTRFFGQLLELSGIADSSIVVLKKDFFALLDASKSQTSAFNVRDDVSFAIAQRCHAKAEAVARLLGGPRTKDGPGSERAAIQYVFSAANTTASMPRWPTDHDLAERRFLISVSWMDELSDLEREFSVLRDVSRAVVDRVLDSVKGIGNLNTAGDAPLQSAQLLRPLYENICRIVPPIRSHVVLEEKELETGKNVLQEPQAKEAQTKPPSEASSDSVVNVDVPASRLTETHDTAKEKVPLRSSALNEAPPVPVVCEAPPKRSDASTHTSIASSSSISSLVLLPSSSPLAQLEAQGSESAQRIKKKEKPPLVDFCSPESVAWWDGLATSTPAPKSNTKSPQENKDTDDLSDSGTTYTTSTSGDASVLGRESLHESDASPRGAKGHDHSRRRRKHCHCLRQQGQCCRHRKRLFTAGDDDYDLAKEGVQLFRAPSASGNGVGGGNVCNGTASRIQLLEFTRVLRPPEEPASTSLQAQVPQSARTRPPLANNNAELLQGKLVTRDDAGEIPLLTLKNNSSASPSRITLYLPSDTNALRAVSADASHEIDIGLKSAPFLSNATSRVSLRYLDPPPLPSSSVFSAPPPLLHLRHGPFAEAAQFASHNTAPAPPPPSSQHAFQPFNGDSNEYGQPYAPFPAAAPPLGREAEQAPMNEHSPFNGVATTTTTNLVQTPLKEPLLSATEMAGFRRYTDDLLARKAAEPLPVPTLPTTTTPGMMTTTTTTTTGSASFGGSVEVNPPYGQVAAAATVAATGGEGPLPDEPHSTGFTRSLDEHNTFLQKTENLFEKRQKENEAFYRRVADSVRALTESTLSLRGGNGLSPVDQSQLLQDSIKQKNELLHLNRDLLDLQLQAARSGDPMSFNRNAPYETQRDFLTGTRAGSVAGAAGVDTATQGIQTERFAAAGNTTTETGVDPLQSGAVTTDPKSASSLQSTLADLNRLNVQLQGINTSAESMEKAIKETREVIQRYQSHEAMEKLSAEGAAMLSNLQYRTAAAEQRLASLPRREPSVRFAAATTEIASPSKRAFTSATFATETTPEGRRNSSEGTRRTSTFTSSQSSALEDKETPVSLPPQATSPSATVTTAAATAATAPVVAAAPASPSSGSIQLQPSSHATTTSSSALPSAPSGGERSVSSRQFDSSESQALRSAFRRREEEPPEDVNSGSVFRPPVLSPKRVNEVGRGAPTPQAVAGARPPPSRPLNSVAPPLRSLDENQQQPVFFTSPRKSLRDVYETSKRRPSEFAPPAATAKSPRRSVKGSTTPKPRQLTNAPIPQRFSMYGPIASSTTKVNKNKRPPPLTSFADLYDQAGAAFQFPTDTPSHSTTPTLQPAALTTGETSNTFVDRQSTRKAEGINKRMELLEKEFGL